MREDLHKQARRLIDISTVEEISPADREWLKVHLEVCPQCAEFADATRHVVRTFRSASVRLNESLVNATRLRVRLRAGELREESAWRPFLWILCALSWVCIVATIPYLWRGFEWIGRLIDAPPIVWQMGFLLWWILPPVVTAVVLTRGLAQRLGDVLWSDHVHSSGRLQ